MTSPVACWAVAPRSRQEVACCPLSYGIVALPIKKRSVALGASCDSQSVTPTKQLPRDLLVFDERTFPRK